MGGLALGRAKLGFVFKRLSLTHQLEGPSDVPISPADLLVEILMFGASIINGATHWMVA